MPAEFEITLISEKDYNNFKYGDVIGSEKEPLIVLLRFSPSQGVYYYCALDDFTDEGVLRGYNVALVPFVKEKNKWSLFTENPFKWGRVTAILREKKE